MNVNMLTRNIEKILKFLKENCNSAYYVMGQEYLFGKPGTGFRGLNQILLELKKTIFYSKFKTYSKWFTYLISIQC